MGELNPRAGLSASEVQYHDASSLGHELGVMFGGIIAMVLGAYGFYFWWRTRLAAERREEDERIRDLKARGLLDERKR
ncbi:hypothetical protein BU24DRAFT_497907 [Aaosphaeria arxii CBS 175.79]|uniref:Uncharacterized protein n=1 Tax=Aaosphaeria arxii CBS 175.79 TaxID=1450172 RepID=A0A6A5X641_9PLEO|nr:uncharacterized protein BU24DRAFT_497907 [Aaosphaeria arxii CBS 175.79]KAF2008448.1 hypothetical protein BU24DRAFT_497907 [Aaosphaeria arxii CBS 175.79]